MDKKIKIYCDSGADITFLKEFFSVCEFIQFPYDSVHRPKNKKMDLTDPSDLAWQNAHLSWGESKFTWEDFSESDIFGKILAIVGANNRLDASHLDSAYKSGADVFLTSDKKDIFSKKYALEIVCKFKIFYTAEEKEAIVACIEAMIANFKF